MKTKVSPKKVARVLIECHGYQFRAARRLGITAATIINYKKKFPIVQEAYDKAKGLIGDLAESKLYQAIQKGEAWAICFYLKTQCRNRGYIEKQDLNVKQETEVRFAGNRTEETRTELLKRLTEAGVN